VDIAKADAPGNAVAGPEWRISEPLVEYQDAIVVMEARVAAIRAGQAPELVWLVEHPPLYTAGTSAQDTDLLDARFPVHRTGRGGQWTYHGPGQRVGYVMLDLRARGLGPRDFVRAIEAWLLAALGRFGVRAETREGRTGIWIADRRSGQEDKIGAIGVRVSGGVSWHGFALNLEPALEHYAGITPCGIRGHGVTSLARLGLLVTMAELDAALIASFGDVFRA